MRGDVDTLNPVDGSLSVRIPIPLPKGRGLDLPFSIGYNSNSKWHPIGGEITGYAPMAVSASIGMTPGGSAVQYIKEYLNWGYENDFVSLNGWSYNVPTLAKTKGHQYWQYDTHNYTVGYAVRDCQFYTGYVFSTPQGGRQQLNLFRREIDTSGVCPTDVSSEDSGASFDAQLAENYPTHEANISDLNGTVYRFPQLLMQSRGITGETVLGLPDLVEDRNGNRIQMKGDLNGSLTYADTLARTLLQTSGFGHEGDIISVSGLAGNYVMHWSTITISGFSTSSQSFIPGDSNSAHATSSCLGMNDVANQSLSVLTSIDLPNGTSYRFDYDQIYGLLTKITLPTGGWVRFTWKNNPLAGAIEYDRIRNANHWLTPDPSNPDQYPAPQCVANYDKWAVDSREESFDGTSVARRDQYNYATSFLNNYGNNQFWSNKTTTVSSTDLISGIQQKTVHEYIPGSAYGIHSPGEASLVDPTPVETTTTTTGSGGESEVINRSWIDLEGSPTPSCEQVSRDGFFFAMHTTSYFNGLVLPQEIDDYSGGNCTPAYGNTGAPPVNGTVVRKSVNTYAFASAAGLLANGALPLLQSSKITAPSGALVSEVDYKYDESALAASATVGHDEDCYGLSGPTSQCGTAANFYASTGAIARGNLTTITRSCLSCNSTVEHRSYDTAGNVVSMQDGNGFSTFYSYADQGTNQGSGSTYAFPTRVILPATAGTQHVRSFTYNYASGLMSSATDEAGNTTSYEYSDPLNRLTAVNGPPAASGTQPKTAYNYSDNVGALSITETVQAAPSPNVVHVHHFDGAGNLMQEETASATPSILQNYETSGFRQQFRVSNPYSSPDSPVWSSRLYDALGRLHYLCNQDNGQPACSPGSSYQEWDYKGLQTVLYDERRLQTTHTSDVLGRLSAVIDPAGHSTAYSYDLLGNLTAVSQQGASGESARNRSFQYDSLSRLLTSANPETGQICYGQWSNGSCINGYDANGNLLYKTDARGVLISYSYDALNRLTRKSYSDGTRPQYFGYDGKDETGAALAAPYNQNAIGRLSHTSDTISIASSYGYDSMGRLTQKADCLPSNCAYSDVQTAGYDLAGNMTQMTYPDGHQIQQQFDSAGRLSAVLNGPPGSSNAPYVSSIQYFANGSPNVVSYGNGITETMVQNTRLQPCGDVVASGQSVLLNKSYSYMQNAGAQPCGSEAGNNGNIWHITDNLASGSYTQHMQYDNLNRVTQWQAPSMAGQFRQLYFGYDSFGNLQQSTSPVDPASLPSLYDSGNHRLPSAQGDCQSYDAAGNTACSGIHGTNEQDYTWNGEGQLSSVTVTQNNNGSIAGQYLYDANGQRVRSDNPTAQTWREYVSFGGNVIAERDQTGAWTDHIYALGRKIAQTGMAASTRLHSFAVHSAGGCTTHFVQGGLGGYQYVVQAGDKLIFDQQTFNASGGLVLIPFNAGNDYYTAADTGGAVRQRVIDLGPSVGKTVNGFWPYTQAGGTGVAEMFLSGISIVSTDGTVTPVFNGQAVQDHGPLDSCGGSNDGLVVEQSTTPATTFYVADQVGTAQMEFSATGTPLWKGEFAPFGQELDTVPYYFSNSATNGSANRYRFTGKERDVESGLDYFGARHYGSNMGRWMSPDLVNVTEERLMNPSSTLNKYAYGANNPLKYVDPDGQDITYFYDQTGAAGHAVLFAYNQVTGDSAIESFGPATKSVGTRLEEIGLFQVPATSMFDMNVPKSADELRNTYSALTIQTSPELTQQVINYIKQNPDPATWGVLGPNCSSEVWKILRQFKLAKWTIGGGKTPRKIWNDLYSQYVTPWNLRRNPSIRNDYGNPRTGLNMFDLMWNSLPQSHEKVTVTIKTTDGQVIQ